MSGNAKRRLEVYCEHKKHTIIIRKNRQLLLCDHDEKDIEKWKILYTLGGVACTCLSLLALTERFNCLRKSTDFRRYKMTMEWTAKRFSEVDQGLDTETTAEKVFESACEVFEYYGYKNQPKYYRQRNATFFPIEWIIERRLI